MERNRPSLVGVAALAVALGLPGCGVSIGIGDDFDEAPRVSIAASPTSAAPGDLVRLTATATDDFAVDRVAFYVVEADGRRTLLGSDVTAPYQWDVVMPDRATATAVLFQARAVDDVEQGSDFAQVAVTLER